MVRLEVDVAFAVHIVNDAACLLNRLALLLVEDVRGDRESFVRQDMQNVPVAPAEPAEFARDMIHGLAAARLIDPINKSRIDFTSRPRRGQWSWDRFMSKEV